MRLEDEFSEDNLFMDVEGHIKPGDDFVHVLDEQVGKADVLLAVIGLLFTTNMTLMLHPGELGQVFDKIDSGNGQARIENIQESGIIVSIIISSVALMMKATRIFAQIERESKKNKEKKP